MYGKDRIIFLNKKKKTVKKNQWGKYEAFTYGKNHKKHFTEK